MTAGSRAVLYSPQLLSLAVELAQYPHDRNAQLQGEARSRTCGSTIAFSGERDHEGNLHNIGLRVTACAVGQAAAAIFAGSGEGLTHERADATLASLQAWLDGTGAMPDWPRLDMLTPALPHRGRHEAILLPWRAAADALSKPLSDG